MCNTLKSDILWYRFDQHEGLLAFTECDISLFSLSSKICNLLSPVFSRFSFFNERSGGKELVSLYSRTFVWCRFNCVTTAAIFGICRNWSSNKSEICNKLPVFQKLVLPPFPLGTSREPRYHGKWAWRLFSLECTKLFMCIKDLGRPFLVYSLLCDFCWWIIQVTSERKIYFVHAFEVLSSQQCLDHFV